MSGHRPFIDLTKRFTPEQWDEHARIPLHARSRRTISSLGSSRAAARS